MEAEGEEASEDGSICARDEKETGWQRQHGLSGEHEHGTMSVCSSGGVCGRGIHGCN